jgi:hypothetical protein
MAANSDCSLRTCLFSYIPSKFAWLTVFVATCDYPTSPSSSVTGPIYTPSSQQSRSPRSPLTEISEEEDEDEVHLHPPELDFAALGPLFNSSPLRRPAYISSPIHFDTPLLPPPRESTSRPPVPLFSPIGPPCAGCHHPTPSSLLTSRPFIGYGKLCIPCLGDAGIGPQLPPAVLFCSAPYNAPTRSAFVLLILFIRL